MGKLPFDIGKRISEKLDGVSETGKGFFPLINFKYGYKIRVGDYRILVDIYFDKNLIIVRKIGHRSKIYRN